MAGELFDKWGESIRSGFLTAPVARYSPIYIILNNLRSTGRILPTTVTVASHLG